jgi:hypothetical protein
MYDIAAGNGGDRATGYQKDSSDERTAQEKARRLAEDFEKERGAHGVASAHHEDRHHWLTGSATLIEIGIALSTVAIITRKQTFWYGAMGLGGVGVALFVVAYLT